MTVEGTLRAKYFIKGKFRDMEVHSILKEEFQKNTNRAES